MLPLIAMATLMAPIPVKTVHGPSGWELLRGGKPYVVKGVGGTDRMAELAAAGGNSMRTWGADNAAIELEGCLNNGLTLTIGIWLGHRSYFNYEDAAKVREQYEMVRKEVLRHRNHPALLFWALGNEMEADNNNTPALWKAIEDMAKLVKELDPNHPVMTVIAEPASPEKIGNIKRYAPSIDVLGMNSYGGLSTLPKRLKEAGWDKPYIVTEFGPLGPWERPKTDWKAAIEQTANEKAAFYRSNYENSIQAQKGWCLGSYAFLWGHKQEETPTWFGMFLPTGERTPVIDVMTYLWSGKWPSNRAPEIASFAFSSAQKEVEGGSSVTAAIKATDPNNDRLSFQWEIRREAENKGYAGDGEVKPGVVSGFVDGLATPSISFKVPKAPGSYRLYVTVRDGKGSATTVNSPFHVR